MSTRRFEGRTAIVTGGASGIGAATVIRLVAEGAKVLIADLDESRSSELVDRLDGNASFHRTDVTQRQEVEAAIETAISRFGRLDVLVNNAGVGSFGRTPDLEPDAWHRVIDVDLHSVFYACRAAIPRLQSAGGGAIVNTASISGLVADYGFSAYNAAKGAVVNYTRTLALDHARDGIRVNAVCPGLIDTAATQVFLGQPEILQDYLERIPLGRPGTAEEIADVIAFLASDDARYVTGHCLVADGGLTSHTGQPDFVSHFRRIQEDAR